jgi:hypothetical protein
MTNRIFDSIVGHTDKHGLDLWIAVSESSRISANPGLGDGITLKLGDAFGQGLVLQLDVRQADRMIDALVDALEGARMKAHEKAEEYRKAISGEAEHDEA